MAIPWGEIIGNVASGGLLGLAGSGISALIGIFQAREQRAAARERAAIEKELKALEIQKIETLGRIELQKIEAMSKVEDVKAQASGFDASQAADANAHGASDWVQDYKALTRHNCVYLLILLTGLIFFAYADPEVRKLIVGLVIQLMTCAVCWLYGQRGQVQVTNYISTFK